jgi:hypothetical protein
VQANENSAAAASSGTRSAVLPIGLSPCRHIWTFIKAHVAFDAFLVILIFLVAALWEGADDVLGGDRLLAALLLSLAAVALLIVMVGLWSLWRAPGLLCMSEPKRM